MQLLPWSAIMRSQWQPHACSWGPVDQEVIPLSSCAGQRMSACRQRHGAGVRRMPVRRRCLGRDAHDVRPRLLRRVLAAAPGRADPRGPQSPARLHGRALRRSLRRGAGAHPASHPLSLTLPYPYPILDEEQARCLPFARSPLAAWWPLHAALRQQVACSRWVGVLRYCQAPITVPESWHSVSHSL